MRHSVVWIATVLLLPGCSGGKSVAPITPTTTLSVSGAAFEAAPSAHSLAGVRVQITDGPEAGKEVMSDGAGSFRLSALSSGAIGILATKDGYQPWRVLNMSVDTYREIQIVMYPLPPKDAAGVSATARCNDGSWSWELLSADLCAAHDGPAYAVCPGPFCPPR